MLFQLIVIVFLMNRGLEQYLKRREWIDDQIAHGGWSGTTIFHSYNKKDTFISDLVVDCRRIDNIAEFFKIHEQLGVGSQTLYSHQIGARPLQQHLLTAL